MTSSGLPADSPEQEWEGITHTLTMDKSGLCTEQCEVLKESTLTSPLCKSFIPSITHSDSGDSSISIQTELAYVRHPQSGDANHYLRENEKRNHGSTNIDASYRLIIT